MIRNRSNARLICRSELYAESFFQRLTGMLTRKFSESLDGIVFPDCDAVHTFGMRFALDIIFVDRNNNSIVSIFRNVKPWKVAAAGRRNCLAVELPAGFIDDNLCKTGDILDFTQ